MDLSPPGFFFHGILQARILEWVATGFSKGSSQPKDRTQVSCIAGRFLTAELIPLLRITPKPFASQSPRCRVLVSMEEQTSVEAALIINNNNLIITVLRLGVQSVSSLQAAGEGYQPFFS